MNKAELIDAVAGSLGHSKRDVTDIIDAFLDQTRHICEHGGSLSELGRLILEERLQMKTLARTYQ